jgi:hypothetical protein
MSIEIKEPGNVAAVAPTTMDAATRRANAVTPNALAEDEAVHAQHRTRGVVPARDVRLLLVALWLGAAVFFSFAVAPSAFAVLPARELAGRLVTRTLAIVNVGGFLISLFLLASAFLFRRTLTRRAFYAELASLALLATTTAVGHWIINARLLALRVMMVRPIDEIAPGDPLRVAFNNLHVYSVVVLTVGMIAALVALLLIARRSKQSLESEV